MSMIPRASDIMVKHVITLSMHDPVLDAVDVFRANAISGAPVLDADGRVIGMCSELDCIKLIADELFYQQSVSAMCVADIMSHDVTTVEPWTDVFALAGLFVDKRVRRLPVVASGRLVGQVSRRNLLSAIDDLNTAVSQPPAPVRTSRPGMWMG